MVPELTLEQIPESRRARYEGPLRQALRRRDALPRGSKAAQAAQRDINRWYAMRYGGSEVVESCHVTCLLARLGLSWWADVDAFCTCHGELEGRNLQEFRQKVARAQLQLPSPEELTARGVAVDQIERSLTEWHQQFAEERSELLAFLDQAVARNLPVRCRL